MTEISACIFDLDGVICDTAKYHYLAWKRLADSLGIPFTAEDNESLKGVSRMDSLHIILDLGGISLPPEKRAELATLKNHWYVQSILSMTSQELLPGVKDFIHALREAGIAIGLGSVSKNAQMILNKLHIEDLFDSVIDGTKVVKAKPDPQVFLLGAQELSVSPTRTVVFEDAVAGVRAAHAAGMYCIGVGNPQTLIEADTVIPGFEGMTVGSLPRLT